MLIKLEEEKSVDMALGLDFYGIIFFDFLMIFNIICRFFVQLSNAE